MYEDTRQAIWTDTPTATRTTGPRSEFERQDRARALRALTANRSVLYALRLADGTVKIGCSSNLDARRRHYPGADILGFMAGDHADEKAIHERLVPFRARGREYYRPTLEVLAVVNDMRAEFGMPDLTS